MRTRLYRLEFRGSTGVLIWEKPYGDELVLVADRLQQVKDYLGELVKGRWRWELVNKETYFQVVCTAEGWRRRCCV